MAASRCNVWNLTFIIIIVILTNFIQAEVVQVPGVDGVKLVCSLTVPENQTVNWSGPDLQFQRRLMQNRTTCRILQKKRENASSLTNFIQAEVVQVPEVDGVKLVCSLTVPENQTVNWSGPDGTQLNFDNGTFADSRLSYVDGKDLQIANAVPADNGDYTCTVDAQTAIVTLTVTVTDFPKLNMSFMDQYFDSSRGVYQIRADANESKSFTCMIKGAFPMPSVTLTKMDHNGTLLMTVPDADVTTTSMLESDGTYSVNATATIQLNINTDNNRRIHCNAMFDIDGNTTTTAWPVRIFLREVKPTIFVMSGLGSMSPRDNDVNITCSGSRGRPGLDSINFQIDGEPVAAPYDFTQTTMDCMIIQELEQYYTHLYLCESTLMLKNLTKEVNGKPLGCSFIYQNETIDSSNNTNSLLIFNFPPTMVNLTGNMPVEVSGTSTTDLTLTCATDSSNDASTLFWYNGTSGITVTTAVIEESGEYNGVTVTQSLTLSVDRYMDGNMIRCDAVHIHNSGERPGASVTLNISYSPLLVQPAADIHRVYTGEMVSILCSAEAKPVATTTWRRVYSETNKTEVVSTNGNSVLDIQNVMMSHGGQYECEASNTISPAVTKMITLIVYDKSALEPFSLTTLTPSQSNIFFEFELPTDRQIRALYLQYSTLNNQGEPVFMRETRVPLDTGSNNKVKVTVSDLQPSTTYEFQLREVDGVYGLEAHTYLQTVMTSAADDELTQSDIDRAILISVFVTAAGVAIICTIIFCLVRRGCASSSKGFDLQMKPRV